MLCIDGHLDLAYNALFWNRDNPLRILSTDIYSKLTAALLSRQALPTNERRNDLLPAGVSSRSAI